MMKALKRIAVGLFILSLIVLYIIIYAVPGITGALTQTEILQYGNLKTSDSVTCYFIRNEKVYSAARSGSINYYVGDAVQVKKGAKILDIVTGGPVSADSAESGEAGESEYSDIINRLGGGAVKTSDFASEFNGITSYYIDGYESYFTPETMRELKYGEVSGLDPAPVNVVRGNTAEGEPLYKICDNKEWYIICWIDAGNISKYNRDKRVTVELPRGEVRAVIADVIEDGDKWLIILSTNRYYEDFTKERFLPATVITSDYNGIIVRNESITAEDGTVGVYIKIKNGAYVFKPIRVIATDGEHSIVSVSYYYDEEGDRVDTVNIYDEILIKPGHD